jgi:hypothetical protein
MHSGMALGGWRASSASLLELVEGGRGREMCCRLSPTTMAQKSSRLKPYHVPLPASHPTTSPSLGRGLKLNGAALMTPESFHTKINQRKASAAILRNRRKCAGGWAEEVLQQRRLHLGIGREKISEIRIAHHNRLDPNRRDTRWHIGNRVNRPRNANYRANGPHDDSDPSLDLKCLKPGSLVLLRYTSPRLPHPRHFFLLGSDHFVTRHAHD